MFLKKIDKKKITILDKFDIDLWATFLNWIIFKCNCHCSQNLAKNDGNIRWLCM